MFDDFPEWYYTIHGGDWALQILCASYGKLRYFREVMGVFRRHDRGARYYQTLAAKAKGEEVIAISSKNSLQICDALNRHFNYRYEKLIQKQKAYWYWVGAMEYAQYGKKDSARAYFLKALPHIFPLPHWLTFRALLRSLSIVFLPPIFIAFLHSVKSLIKSLLGLVQVHLQGSGDLVTISLAEKIQKYASEAEAVWGKAYGLFDKVIQVKKFKRGAEVGVAYGGHAEAILNISTLDKLYGVDPYLHTESYHDPMNLPQAEFDELYLYVLERLARFGDRYEHIRKTSKQAVDEIPGQIDFIYIDADHSYDGVWRDLCAWYAKVREGGVIGGHDYDHPSFPSIKKAVDEFFRRFAWKVHAEGEGVWWVEKKTVGISFFMPAYNCEKTIPESVESILEGNFMYGDELVIVDDGSTDNTRKILNELKNKYPVIKLLKHTRNKGGSAARNSAVENTENKILFCLDSDNVLVPGGIRKLKVHLLNSGADVAAFQELYYFKDDKSKVTHKWTFRQGLITLADCLAGPITPGASGNFMFTKESWIRAGGYPEFAGALDSWSFGFRQLAAGSKMMVMPDSYYYHRYGHESNWVRWSKRGKTSLTALQVLLPFLDMLDQKDVDYIMSRKGRYDWFENLEKHPIRLKSGDSGSTGFTTNKKSSNFQIMKAKIIGAISCTLPSSIRDIIRGKR